MTKIKLFCALVVMTFELNHAKSLQIYFLCVKRQTQNDFPKDERRVSIWTYWTEKTDWSPQSPVAYQMKC